MKEVFWALVTENPFPIARDGYPAGSTREVPQFQDRVFYRRIRGHIHGQLGNDTILGMLKYAIAEAMPYDVGRRSGCRQRRWRPKVSVLLITNVKGFSGGVRNRIVVPRRQTKFVRILRPGVAAAAF